MPFTSAFAITGSINFPVITAAFIFILLILHTIISRKINVGTTNHIDVFFASLFLGFCTISFISGGLSNTKSFSHYISYLITFFLFYFAIKYSLLYLSKRNINLNQILKILTLVVFFNAVFVSFEFILINVFQIDISLFLPRPLVEDYNASVLGLFIRARGFAEESGHFSFMMELFSPLVVYYLYSNDCKWSRLTKFLIVLLIVLSLLFAASTASFIIVPLAIFITLFLCINDTINYLSQNGIKLLAVLGILIFSIIIINLFIPIIDMVYFSVTDKFDVSSVSFDDRQTRQDFFYNQFPNLSLKQQLLGVGPASFSILGYDDTYNPLSLYLKFILENGILGFLAFAGFLLAVGIKIYNKPSRLKFFLFISFFCGVIHYHAISNHWYPWFWFVCAIACIPVNIESPKLHYELSEK